MSISENIALLKNSLPPEVVLVAVSKTKGDQAILEALNAGQQVFGENRVQEMTEKWERLPKEIQWHMIGHVQRNKVKYMAPFVALIHGVDSLRLLKEIDKQGKRFKRRLDCLLQIHIAEEESKFGFDAQEIIPLLKSEEFAALSHVRVRGLMGMATFTEDKAQIRKEFKGLKSLCDGAKAILPEMAILSMGMSNDYEIAIEEGSNMVRIGSRIFGPRQ